MPTEVPEPPGSALVVRFAGITSGEASSQTLQIFFSFLETNGSGRCRAGPPAPNTHCPACSTAGQPQPARRCLSTPRRVTHQQDCPVTKRCSSRGELDGPAHGGTLKPPKPGTRTHCNAWPAAGGLETPPRRSCSHFSICIKIRTGQIAASK